MSCPHGDYIWAEERDNKKKKKVNYVLQQMVIRTMKKNENKVRHEHSRGEEYNFTRGGQGCLTEEVTSRQRSEGGEGAGPGDFHGEGGPDRSWCSCG